MTENGGGEVLAYGICAKVRPQTAHGPGGVEAVAGLAHFAPGAKVWVLPPQWGDGGAKLMVVGYHRGTSGRGYVRIVIDRRHLSGFRAQPIYSPALLSALTRPDKGTAREPRLWPTLAEAELQAQHWS